jgi:hypothetical protein
MTTTLGLEQLRTHLEELRAVLGTVNVALLHPDVQPAPEDLQTLLRLAWLWAQRAQALAIQVQERAMAEGRPLSWNSPQRRRRSLVASRMAEMRK